MVTQRTLVVASLVAVLVACAPVTRRVDRQLDRGHPREAVAIATGWLERRSDHDDAAEVRAALERARWAEAAQIDTPEGWQAYRDDFPETSRTDELDERQAAALWHQRIRPADTLTAYAEFLEDWGHTEIAAEAEARSARIRWRYADAEGTVDAYVQFLSTTSDEELTRLATQKLASLQWAAAEASDPYAMIEAAEVQPDEASRAAVMRIAEVRLWDLARRTDDPDHYQALRTLFPASEWADESYRRERDLRWTRAERNGRPELYEGFAAAYGDDQRAGLAEVRAVDLRYFRSDRANEDPTVTITQIDDRDPTRVIAYADVRDRLGVLVSGLSSEDLRVYESGRRAELIDVVGMERNRPIDVVFVIDNSGSMNEEIWAVKMGAVRFAQTLRNRQRDVRLGLVHFTDTAQVHGYGQLTDDPQEFAMMVDSVGESLSGTENPMLALLTAASMQFRPEAQRVLILLTDEPPNISVDPFSEMTAPMVAEYLADAGMSLFLITSGELDYTLMSRVAGAPRYDIGGDVPAALDQIAARLSLQYQVVYQSPFDDERASRQVRVRVDRPTIWLPAGAMPLDDLVALHPDPDERCRLLAVARTGGLARSEDCGETWSRLALDAPLEVVATAGDYGRDRLVYLLDADGTLHVLSGWEGPLLRRDQSLRDIDALAWTRSRGREVWVVRNDTIWFSPDDGITFTEWGPVPPNALVGSLAVDPSVSSRVCMLDRSGTLWCRQGSGSWSSFGRVPWGSSPSDVRLVACPWDTSLWFVWTADGLYRTWNGGLHWAPVEVRGTPVRGGRLLVGSASSRRVCVALDDGVWCSNDGGLYWSRTLAGGASHSSWTVAMRPDGAMYAVGDQSVYRLFEVASREFVGSALFPYNSDEPYPEAYPLIEQMGRALASDATLRVRVEGHTDSDGSDEMNLDLSERRAARVADILRGAGAGADQVTSRGFGETRPLFPNDSPENRQANRRVEMVLIREMGSS